MLTDQTRWSLGRGKPLVPSRWQATGLPPPLPDSAIGRHASSETKCPSPWLRVVSLGWSLKIVAVATVLLAHAGWPSNGLRCHTAMGR
jgi:hypothetical protein